MNKTALLETEYPNTSGSTLEDLLGTPIRRTAESRAASQPQAQSLTVLGKVLGFAASGLPLVDFEGNPEPAPLSARHTCAISSTDIGSEAVLVFECDDIRKPIVLGVLHPVPGSNSADSPKPISATVDGKQITLTAENEIVLRCGKASITLTRAGKVLINGEYLLSKSNGVNRIKGGSVQIN